MIDLLKENEVLLILYAIIIPVMSITINNIFSFSKQKQEKDLHYEKQVEKKLEFIYSPLNITYQEMNPLSLDLKELVRSYNHLLSQELSQVLRRIIYMEEKAVLLEAEEYALSKRKAAELIEKEYVDLCRLHRDNFKKFKSNKKLSSFEKIISVIRKIGGTITAVTFAVLISFSLFYDIYTFPLVEGNYYHNILAVSLILIITVTSIVWLGEKGAVLLGNTLEKFKQKKGVYRIDRNVLVTGKYICNKCEEEEKLYERGEKFLTCSNCTKWETLKATLWGYSWTLDRPIK